MSEFFPSGGQRIGASASASVLPMNIQDRFPLGLTGLISLQSKGKPGVLEKGKSWRRERLPTPVFWPGEFHGLYNTWDHKESDTTEQFSLTKIESSDPITSWQIEGEKVEVVTDFLFLDSKTAEDNESWTIKKAEH